MATAAWASVILFILVAHSLTANHHCRCRCGFGSTFRLFLVSWGCDASDHTHNGTIDGQIGRQVEAGTQGCQSDNHHFAHLSTDGVDG
jgi:hypothetical protein